MDNTRPTSVTASRILVVDDTHANLVAVEAALSSLGRPLITASSGSDALAHLLDKDFALALVDVSMPGMDGFELARLIRSRERTQHLPIIFITAHAQDEASVSEGYDLGAVDFLFRPVLADVLRAKASVFVMLQERTEQLAAERLERELENQRRDYERARELAAREELARLNATLAEYDRRKDSFLAILAHELRNPLAPLRTSIDLIEASPDRSVSPRIVEALKRQTGILVRLVDDLLDLSRIKADKIELRPERVDLVDVVELAIATSRPLIDERRHALLIEAPTEPVWVVADTVRMSQVLCNLLNNAARYTKPGGRIEVTIASDGDEAIVTVKDNGVGIPLELQESIFNMFVQERVRSDGSGGLGLGLALARRLVELHNGTIRVHSAGKNQGSTFEVRIPLEGTAHALAPRKRTDEMAPLERPARVIRTLVIDDNEDARELLAEVLRTNGFEVLTAGDGSSGLALLREHRPDVAIIDVGLPKLDGIGVVETVRRDYPDITTRLIALTGYGNPDAYERTRKAGFHAHLVKPASIASVLECIRQQLAERS